MFGLFSKRECDCEQCEAVREDAEQTSTDPGVA
jgi:hypothetical protein